MPRNVSNVLVFTVTVWTGRERAGVCVREADTRCGVRERDNEREQHPERERQPLSNSAFVLCSWIAGNPSPRGGLLD